MFGLLNPALTPIKAKIALVVAGAVVVALLAAGGLCWYLSRKVDGLQTDLGTASANWASAVQNSNDNNTAWDLERANYEQRIAAQLALTKLAQDATRKEQADRDKFDRALRIALNTLKETAHADPEAAEWSIVPLPDSIVDGMCRAAAAAAGEAQNCHPDEGQGGDAAGEPAGAVRDSPTT